MPFAHRRKQTARSLALAAVIGATGCANHGGAIPSSAGSDIETLNLQSAGATHETVLHSFGGPDGGGPAYGVITGAAGALYGTTIFGGAGGGGTVFEMLPETGGYDEHVLYSFSGGLDGNAPLSGLVMDKSGALYGVTLEGGYRTCFAGCGVVFKLSRAGSNYTERTLYRFTNRAGDANQPVGTPVLDGGGNLYGITQFGGTSNNGAVFKLTAASNYSESIIYSLPGGSGGSQPQAGLAIDGRGTLYGTANSGGDLSACQGSGCGLVFTLSPAGSGYVEKALCDFKGGAFDGEGPTAALTVDPNTGAIFGTTLYGGKNLYGTVFTLTPSRGGYTERVLHSFPLGAPQGGLPNSQLKLTRDGSIYGTSMLGGGGCNGIGCGAIFKLTPSGSTYTFSVVYDFRDPLNGADPESTTLILDANGRLLGTTRSGGTKTACSDGGPGDATGCGVLFKLTQ